MDSTSVSSQLVWVCVKVLSLVVITSSYQARSQVKTKHGILEGSVVPLSQAGLPDAESYLGIPYATPPVGPLRFMPPTEAPSWPGIRQATRFAPVCPQVIPDRNDTALLRAVSRGRRNYLKNLFPLLRDQSEDCLYLNVYAPKDRSSYKRLPVLVFIHGESFEWNSGNPYDGSVLAAFNSLIVVTINYRLGILGFFKTESGDKRLANFGLLDQVAALHWLRENVAAFGGDSGDITLVGHGTGAALVTHLMASDVVKPQALFQKALLLSGSALSPMAIVSNPEYVRKEVAKYFRCGSTEGEELLDCLRDKSAKDLIQAKIQMPPFKIHFGPIVDGVVISERPREGLEKHLSGYEVIFGLTQSESYHMFPETVVSRGYSNEEQREFLTSYIARVYKRNPKNIVDRVLNEYTGFRQLSNNNLSNRDVILEVFSDAWVVAPEIEQARIMASFNRNNVYLYVFEHRTRNSYYPGLLTSVHTEDLPFLFGMPLNGGSYHMKIDYSKREELLSKIMMTFLSNFIRKGNPSIFRRNSTLTRQRKPNENDLPEWPRFTPIDQAYLSIGTDIVVKSHYRHSETSLWIDAIPRFLNESSAISFDNEDSETYGQESAPDVIGRVSETPKDDDYPSLDSSNDNQVAKAGLDPQIQSYLLFIGIILFVINACVCAGLFYQKRRIRQRESNLHQQMRRYSQHGVIGNGSFANEELNAEQEFVDSCWSQTRQSDHSHHGSLRGPDDSIECPECQMAQTYALQHSPPQIHPDSIYVDRNYDMHQQSTSFDQNYTSNDLSSQRKSNFFPMFTKGHKRKKSPPDPIIEMVPIEEYEKRPVGHLGNRDIYEQFTFPRPAQRHFDSSSNSTKMYVHQNGVASMGRGVPVAPERVWPIPSPTSTENRLQENPLPPPPILSKVGDKTPAGALKNLPAAETSQSVRDWCSKYNQAFLSKTVATASDEDDQKDEMEEQSDQKG